ncbi:hypothetical protein BGZ80_001259 [Entomortierella chlamydospora]|uniref:Uncharacterized protein n=1 Tax=Entomortierella chlamydospora TaxID=101097 RepID=A0A9P6SY32_9FUNG|nr:hypothetical protein BGZ79_001357 [Entomortierella chlamydospora]KAG0010692.1 hypothetical protein BGZ80_001259 [Entomortierella chlamydospora]
MVSSLRHQNLRRGCSDLPARFFQSTHSQSFDLEPTTHIENDANTAIPVQSLVNNVSSYPDPIDLEPTTHIENHTNTAISIQNLVDNISYPDPRDLGERTGPLDICFLPETLSAPRFSDLSLPAFNHMEWDSQQDLVDCLMPESYEAISDKPLSSLPLYPPHEFVFEENQSSRQHQSSGDRSFGDFVANDFRNSSKTISAVPEFGATAIAFPVEAKAEADSNPNSQQSAIVDPSSLLSQQVPFEVMYPGSRHTFDGYPAVDSIANGVAATVVDIADGDEDGDDNGGYGDGDDEDNDSDDDDNGAFDAPFRRKRISNGDKLEACLWREVVPSFETSKLAKIVGVSRTTIFGIFKQKEKLLRLSPDGLKKQSLKNQTFNESASPYATGPEMVSYVVAKLRNRLPEPLDANESKSFSDGFYYFLSSIADGEIPRPAGCLITYYAGIWIHNPTAPANWHFCRLADLSFTGFV